MSGIMRTITTCRILIVQAQGGTDLRLIVLLFLSAIRMSSQSKETTTNTRSKLPVTPILLLTTGWYTHLISLFLESLTGCISTLTNAMSSPTSSSTRVVYTLYGPKVMSFSFLVQMLT